MLDFIDVAGRARRHDRARDERQRRQRRGRAARARSTRTTSSTSVPESLEENLRRIDDLGGPDAHNHYPWGWAWAGNTPLKRWKRETHEGGVTDPLIVSWPARARTRRGEVRHQYVHAIDVMPTLLDVDRHRAAGRARRRRAAPARRAPASAPRSTDAAAPSPRPTQYYEMLGCRAIYHDGWKAVTFHPMVGFAYDGSDPTLPFDEDVWELYHVAEDFSETVDLAAEEPERLRAAGRPVVVGGGAQPGAAAEQPARPPRRPAPPPRALRVPRRASACCRRPSRPNLRNRGFRITRRARPARTAAPTA